MGYTTEEQAIMTRVSTEWGSTTPVAWPNVDFDPETEAKSGNDWLPWVRISVIRGTGSAVQADIAESPRHRHFGTLSADVFSPQGAGTAPALTLADSFAASFRSVTAGGITYRTPSMTTVGSDGVWHQVNVSVPFYRDEVF